MRVNLKLCVTLVKMHLAIKIHNVFILIQFPFGRGHSEVTGQNRTGLNVDP